MSQRVLGLKRDSAGSDNREEGLGQILHTPHLSEAVEPAGKSWGPHGVLSFLVEAEVQPQSLSQSNRR